MKRQYVMGILVLLLSFTSNAQEVTEITENSATTAQIQVPEFATAEECSDFILDHFGFVPAFDFWVWFQKFALVYERHSVSCDNITKECDALFFTNIRLKPEGGGCDLVGTPFWDSDLKPMLEEQIRRLESKEPSLPSYSYAIHCEYQVGLTPFEGQCDLQKEPN